MLRLTLAAATMLLLALSVGVRADLGVLDPMARPSTRLAGGFVLALNVSANDHAEEEMCGQFPLDADGRLQLVLSGQPLPRIPLKGLTVAEARKRIAEAIGPYYRVEPEVRVGIAKMPRFRVVMEGALFRNGPLDLPAAARLSDALAAVGSLPSADLHSIQIARIEKDGSRSTLVADFASAMEKGADERNDPPLQNADRITVNVAFVPVAPSTVLVLGQVKRPGTTLYKSGMTVRDALEAAQDMLPTADPTRVTLVRGHGGGVMLVDGLKAKKDIPTDNLVLRPDDTLFVNTRDSGQRYAVVGAVPAPATFDYTKPVTLKQAIQDAGGFRPNADRRNLVLVRNMLSDPANASSVPINYDKIAQGDLPDIPLQPGDMIQVPPKKKAGFPLLDLGMFVLRLFMF